MFFEKNIHQSRNKTSSNLLGNRFVFFAISGPDYREMESRDTLPTAYVHGQNLLGSRLDQYESEISIREGRSKAKRVMAGFFEGGKTGLDEIKTKKEACSTKYEQLKSAIKSPKDLTEALNEAEMFSNTLFRVRSEDLNQANIGDLLGSDIGVFFSDSLAAQLDTAAKKMVTTDKVMNEIVFQKNDTLLYTNASNDWKVEEKGLKTEIKSLKNEHSGLKKLKDPNNEQQKQLKEIENKIENIKAALKNRTNWINRRMAEMQADFELQQEGNASAASIKSTEEEDRKIYGNDYESYIELVKQEAQSKESQRDRKRQLIKKLEDQNVIAVASKMGYEAKLELTNILLESKAILEERILDYFKGKFNQAKDLFKSLKKKRPSRFSNKVEEGEEKSEAENIEDSLNQFEGTFLNPENLFRPTPENPQIYKGKITHVNSMLTRQLANLTDIESGTEVIEEIDSDPESIKKDVKRKFENVTNSMKEFTPERVDQIIEALNKEEKERIAGLKPDEMTKWDKKGQSPNHNKKVGSLLWLRDNPEVLKREYDELASQIENIETLSPAEIVEIISSLDQLHRTTSMFSGNKIDIALGNEKPNEAMLARQAINLIKNEQDPEKFKGILDKHFGEGHVDLVEKNEFKHYGPNDLDLTKHTGGNMVFYERGDTWKFIINKEVLADGEKMRRQITHELLHLEFEQNKDLQEQLINDFTNHENWPDIESNLLERFSKKDKQPPEGTIWKAKDLVSEIYAMSDEFKDSSSELAKLVMPVMAPYMNMSAERVSGYEEAGGADDVTQGSDAGGGGGDDEVIDMESASGSAEENEQQINQLFGQINSYLKSDYIGYMPGAAGLLDLMKKHLDETKEMNDHLAKNPSGYISEVISKRLEQVKDDIEDVRKAITEASEGMPNHLMNPIMDLWNKTAFLSISDVVQVGIDIKEWWERRHKRKKADHAAKLGMALFKDIPLPFASEFGLEAEAREQKAEAEEVSEWEGRLNNLDGWQLSEILKKMARQIDPNRDQLKAILRTLAKKGRIDWREPALWTLLSKMQSAVPLSPNDEILLRDPILLKQRLHQACGEIWDYDEYLTLERDNESNYDSHKQKFIGTFDKIQNQITPRLTQLQKKFLAGDKVDPMEYEALLEYSITNGKSSAENVMFHLMTGMAHGIIPPDRGLTLDKFLNKWPATQWIYSKVPPLTQKDYMDWCKNRFAESLKNGEVGEDFKSFYWTDIQNDSMVIQRVRKSVSEREWDHDWGRSVACMGDANTAKRFFSGRSGQQEAKDTAVENSYVGALQWLEENAKKPSSNAREMFTRQIAWVSMADGIIDDVAYDRGASDIYTRGNASILNAVPREAIEGNHAGQTTKFHRDKIREFMDHFDSPFFAMLRDQTEAKKAPEALGEKIKAYLTLKYPSLAKEVESVTHIDHIFEKMDAIIGAIVSTADESTFSNALQYLRDGAH